MEDTRLHTYTLDEHRHIFSAWCASTAARSSPKCRFKVELGKIILDRSFIIPSRIDNEIGLLKYETFDTWHNNLCDQILMNAKDISGFSFGIAAKMLNCYLKACYLSKLDDLPFIHPPIDRLLLGELGNRKIGNKEMIWSKYEKIGWSNFTCADYYSVIDEIRSVLPTNYPLWKIEAFWVGHQS